MLSLIKEQREDIYLKKTLMTVLENLGVSHQEIANLLSSFDEKIEFIEDTNLFKFNNTEIVFDFGIEINEKIESSSIIIDLDKSLLLKKVQIHFFNKSSELLVCVKYNDNCEFIDLIYSEEKKDFEDYIQSLKINDQKSEEKRLKAYQSMVSHVVFTRLKKNKKIIEEITDKLNFLNDYEKNFEYICNNFLLKDCRYEEWKINNLKKFRIFESSEGLSIHTNIFNTGIFPDKSHYFVQKCVISFDSDLKIKSFNFIIKQIKIGNYWIYSFDLDSNFNLNKVCRMDIATGQKMKHYEHCCTGVTFEEIVSILKFKLSDNDGIYEIIPEFIVPSAYNFNSEDFKKRMLIAEMLLV